MCVRQSRFNFLLNAETLASLKSTPGSNFGWGVALKVTARMEVRLINLWNVRWGLGKINHVPALSLLGTKICSHNNADDTSDPSGRASIVGPQDWNRVSSPACNPPFTPRLVWCDEHKHNSAILLSASVYCFSLLQIWSLAGIRLHLWHLRPLWSKHGGLLWFAGWFPVQLFHWEPVGGVLMKGLTEAALFFFFPLRGPSLCPSSYWVIWLNSGRFSFFTLQCYFFFLFALLSRSRFLPCLSFNHICLFTHVWWYFPSLQTGFFAVFRKWNKRCKRDPIWGCHR